MVSNDDSSACAVPPRRLLKLVAYRAKTAAGEKFLESSASSLPRHGATGLRSSEICPSAHHRTHAFPRGNPHLPSGGWLQFAHRQPASFGGQFTAQRDTCSGRAIRCCRRRRSRFPLPQYLLRSLRQDHSFRQHADGKFAALCAALSRSEFHSRIGISAAASTLFRSSGNRAVHRRLGSGGTSPSVAGIRLQVPGSPSRPSTGGSLLHPGYPRRCHRLGLIA